MVPILMAMLLAAPNPGSSLPERRMTLRDQLQGPMAVTDKMLIPSRVPDCVGDDQIRQAQIERIKGWEPECMLPRADHRKQDLPH
ncbi:MAG TPA: hypothetical protein VIK68_04430 [Sphingomicrobium sp.]